MAISEREQEAVREYYQNAAAGARLTEEIEAPAEIDVLYPYGDGPCVLRIQKVEGEKKSTELWACTLSLEEGEGWRVLHAIQVGTQDEVGRITWAMG